MTIKLSDLNLSELLELQTALPKEIEKRRGQALASARREVQQIAANLGMTLEDLIAAPISGNHGTRPALYRHPEDATVTWSGSGRQPNWFKQLIDQGYSIDQLRIGGADQGADQGAAQ